MLLNIFLSLSYFFSSCSKICIWELLLCDWCWALCYESYGLLSLAAFHYSRNTTGMWPCQDGALSPSGKKSKKILHSVTRAAAWFHFFTWELLQSSRNFLSFMKVLKPINRHNKPTSRSVWLPVQVFTILNSPSQCHL